MIGTEQELETGSERREPSRIGLTFPHLLVFVAVLVPAIVALRASMATIDLAYQIRAGEIMLHNHHVLRTDLFSFTEFGRSWLNQQWGAQVLLALLFRVGGWEAISMARGIIASASFLLLYLACRAQGAGMRPAAWLSLGGLLVAVYGFVPRPQMFAFFLFALTLVIVAERHAHPRWVFVLPVLTVIWANLHGSFFLPPIVLIVAWLEDRRRPEAGGWRLPAIAAACLAAVTLNPYGFAVWRYVLDLSTNPEVRKTIEEWQPPRLFTFTGLVFFASAVVIVSIVVRHRRELPWPRLLALIVFFLIGATAVRGIIWWALAAPVLVADRFPGRSSRPEGRRLTNAAIAIVLGLLAIVYLPWFRPTYASSADSTGSVDGLLTFAPVRYTDAVSSTVPPGSRVFAAEVWASWFEFAVPRYPVMIDPRIELFPSPVWHDYDTVSDARAGWQAILDRWKVDVLALSRSQQSKLIRAIGGDPAWRLVYRDADGALLVRSPGP